jgi:hypothetical protein
MCWRSSPSIYYFLLPKLAELGLHAHTDLVTGLLQGINSVSNQPELSVICRYVNAKQLKQLQSQKRHGIKTIYFMDDDLLDPWAWGGLPWRYRFKLFTQAFIHKRQLLAVADEVWVSTPYLQYKYAHLKPMLVTAKPTPATAHTQHDSAVLVCYHGTASHIAEFKWLFPIMQEVLKRNPLVYFELFADSHTAKLFRKLPRTAVLHPMSWPQYLAYTQSRKAAIGLAPLLPSMFNAARGSSKWMDYARMGALGIFTDVPPYSDHVLHAKDGLLLPNDPAAWVQTILELADNSALRAEMQLAVKARLSSSIQ